MLIIFPQTELLVNLAVFNLLELAGGADIAEYECRRKHSGLPSKHKGLQLVVVFPCLPNDLIKTDGRDSNRMCGQTLLRLESARHGKGGQIV